MTIFVKSPKIYSRYYLLYILGGSDLAIRYKGGGRYAYETRNKWNKEKKKYETVWTYLGVVNTDTGEYQKKTENKTRTTNTELR